MPSTIGKCKLFRIKHTTLLEGDTFLRNKHEIAFFEIKCTFFGRKENTISLVLVECWVIRQEHIVQTEQTIKMYTYCEGSRRFAAFFWQKPKE